MRGAIKRDSKFARKNYTSKHTQSRIHTIAFAFAFAFSFRERERERDVKKRKKERKAREK